MRKGILFLMFVLSFIGNAQISVNEGFEAATLPTGWSIQTAAANTNVGLSTTAPITGSRSFVFNFGTIGNGILITRNYASNGAAIRASFKSKETINSQIVQYTLEYQIGNGPFVQLPSTARAGSTTVVTNNFTIPAFVIPAGASVRFFIGGIRTGGGATVLYVDDVRFDQHVVTNSTNTISEYNFNNTLVNIGGSEPFSATNTTFTSNRNSVSNNALSIAANATGTSATITGLSIFNEARTISFWYKLNANTANASIFAYGTASANSTFGMYVQNTGRPVFQSFGTDAVFGTGNFAAGTWHHAVLSYDGTDVRIYMNKILQGTLPYSLTTGSSAIRFGNSSVTVDVDDLKIYDYAISGNQVENLFNFNSLIAPASSIAFSNLTSSAITNTTATVSVTLANVCAGATYRIQYSTSSAFTTANNNSLVDNEIVTNVANGVNNINLTNLLPNTQYFFRFYGSGNQACNPSSIYSSTANFTTLSFAVTPTFTQVAPICVGATLAALPTISTNGITGTWLPALNNTATTIYTFTPANGEFSNTTTMTIEVTSTKTWTGASWTPCAPTSTDDAIIAGNYAVAANLTVKSLTVNNNAVASIPSGYDLVVTDIVTVATGSSLTLQNNANLLQTSTSANVGNIIVKRNTVMQRLAYTNWSSPVAAQNASAFSPLTIADRFYTYNEVANAFQVLPAPSSTNFSPTKGYGVRAPNTFADAPSAATQFVGTFTGVPNNGNYLYSATNSGINKGYNLIGNPYPSTILASAFFAANSTVTTLYFWNNTILGANSGDNYATKTALTSVRAASDINSLKLPTDFIASGQGFFAQVSAAATLNFNNTMRSSDNASAVFFRNGNVDKHLFKINLMSPSNSYNQIAIGYANGATSGIDNQIDAVPFADSPIMISSLINNADFVIQGKGLPFNTSDFVPMGFKTNVAGSYSMTSEAFEGVFAENQNIFLKDNLAGITHNIKESPYSFTTNTGNFNNRFEIVYTNSVLGIENPSFNENTVFVFKKYNAINVNSGTTQMKNVQIYDLRGRLVAEKSNVNAITSIINLNVEQQVLLVKITTIDNQQINKKIVY